MTPIIQLDQWTLQKRTHIMTIGYRIVYYHGVNFSLVFWHRPCAQICRQTSKSCIKFKITCIPLYSFKKGAVLVFLCHIFWYKKHKMDTFVNVIRFSVVIATIMRTCMLNMWIVNANEDRVVTINVGQYILKRNHKKVD